METGEILTRGTIWLALGLSVAGSAADRLGLGSAPWQTASRWAWSAACFSYLLHVNSAFNFYHAWSHVAAAHETARQTAEIFGIDWGGGLFVNYAFTAAWIADSVWRWNPASYERRHRSVTAVWRGFFLLMVFSGTVVFVAGLGRWIGLVMSVALALLWWLPKTKTS